MKAHITLEIAKDILKQNSIAQFRVYYSVLYFCSGKYDQLHDFETVKSITGIKDKYLINRYLKQLVDLEYATVFEGKRKVYLMKGINRLYGYKFLRKRDHKVQLPSISILKSNIEFRTFLYTMFEVTKMGKSVVHNKSEYARQSLSYVATKIDKGLSTISHHRRRSNKNKWIDVKGDFFIIEENTEPTYIALQKQMILEAETFDFGTKWSKNLIKGLEMFNLTHLSYKEVYSRLEIRYNGGRPCFAFILSSLVRSNLNTVKFKVRLGKEQDLNVQNYYNDIYSTYTKEPFKTRKTYNIKRSKINLTCIEF